MALFGAIAIHVGRIPDVTGQGTMGETKTDSFELQTATGRNAGMQFTSSNSGNVAEVTWEIVSVTTPGDYHVEVWSNSGNNPSAQVGGNSATVTISAGGTATFTWSTNKPNISSGTVYWLVLVAEATGNFINVWACNPVAGFKSCRNNTITSMDATSEANALYEWIAGY